MIELSIQSITSFMEDENVFYKELEEMDPGRREKIAEMVQKTDKCRMLAAGHLLRDALFARGYRLKELTVQKNEHGKPYMKELPDFYYNLSHSGEYAVCAVSDQPVGIDIEGIRFAEEKDWERMDHLAARIMTADEQAAYWKIRPEERPVEFTKLWTKKESVAKLLGCGMQLPFGQIDTLHAGTFFQTWQKEGYVICVAAEENQPCIWLEQMVTS